MNLQELKKILVIDDIDKMWPKEVLVSALNLPTMVGNSICRWHSNEKEMSMAELFDVIISDEIDPRKCYLISPLLELKYIGKNGFLATVKALTKIKFGKKCQNMWNKKHKKFLLAHRVKGTRRLSWSFAITENGEKMAKFRCGTPYLPRRRKTKPEIIVKE